MADSIRCPRKALILRRRLWRHHSSDCEPIVPTAYAEYLEPRNASIFVIKKSPERNQIGVPPFNRPKTEAEEHQIEPFHFPSFLAPWRPPTKHHEFPIEPFRPTSNRTAPLPSIDSWSFPHGSFFNPPKMGARRTVPSVL